MDVMLHNHKARHVCDTPDGLRELCADISREVIRTQPLDIYDFVSCYLDSLMITRENAKVAMKVVRNVTLKSEQIVEILSGTGLKLEKIAAAAPRLQKAFRAYFDAIEGQRKECGCDDDSDIEDESEISICRILNETGASLAEAHCAATKIQALFRGHYERMSLAEKRGQVQWQRAAVNTVEILLNSGISRNEASQAAVIIQAAYRGYYTRKNLYLEKCLREQEASKVVEQKMDIAVWLDMMLQNYGLTSAKANEAATVVQNAYRRYRERKQQGRELFPGSKSYASSNQTKYGSYNEDDISISKQEKNSRFDLSDDDLSDSDVNAKPVGSTASIQKKKIAEIDRAELDNSAEDTTTVEESAGEGPELEDKNKEESLALVEPGEEEEGVNEDENNARSETGSQNNTRRTVEEESAEQEEVQD